MTWTLHGPNIIPNTTFHHFYACVTVYVCERDKQGRSWGDPSPFFAMCHKKEWKGRIPPLKKLLWCYSPNAHPYRGTVAKEVSLLFHLWLWVYSSSSVKMMDDKLNLCLGSEGELWQSDLSWEWRVRVRRNWAPQGTRHWQIHPARRISEAFCFESWLLTSDPHPSSCQPLKDASPCQGSSAPLILVIHFGDRLRPILSRHMKERSWNIYSCAIMGDQM